MERTESYYKDFPFCLLIRTFVREKINAYNEERTKVYMALSQEDRKMSNIMTVWNEKEMLEWKEILNSDDSIKRFEVKNVSDYSGVEYEIGYDYVD